MSTEFAFGPFILDMQREGLQKGSLVAVSSKGLQLLEALLGSRGRVLTKAELMRAAWGDAAVEESNLSVQIAAPKKAARPDCRRWDWITTIPRVGYRFVEPAQVPTEGNAEVSSPPVEREHRPSIAVLPFANLSDEKEQEYLADGITEDIITALTRFRWFFVIGAIQASHTKASHSMQSRSRRSWGCDICLKEACASPASIFEFRPSSSMPHRETTFGLNAMISN
jgi:DNA-binding winged helix-turn-helix (wHTH) protein